jgi:RND superfamily putative drug exporter
MDAFVIRGTLVPAFMRLAGNANWWLPSFLKPVYARFQIAEGSGVEEEVVSRPLARPRSKPKPKVKTAARKPASRTNGRKPAARKSPARKPAARKSTSGRSNTSKAKR